jgi:hypothetical protein
MRLLAPLAMISLKSAVTENQLLFCSVVLQSRFFGTLSSLLFLNLLELQIAYIFQSPQAEIKYNFRSVV